MSTSQVSPEIVTETEGLILKLDLSCITRPEWDRLKSILTLATLEAGDAEAGRTGYESTLRRWHVSEHYDGQD